MTDNEKITALIAYLQALVEVRKADVIVYDEIQRTVKKLDELLTK